MRKKRVVLNHAGAEVANAGAFFNGSIARRLLANDLDVTKALRTNTLLRKDEWIELDRALVDVARQRLQLITDLRSMGLVHALGGLGTLISEYEQVTDMDDANVDMSGVTEGEEDAPDFPLVGVPVPIHHKSFRVNIRKLAASRKRGDGVDVTSITIAGRKVADSLEAMALNGITGTLAGQSMYGYRNHPDRNTGTAVGDFGTIGNIAMTVANMVAAAEADSFYGPYILYVAATQYGEMRSVYTDGSGQSAIIRILQSIPTIKQIKPCDQLTAGELLLVQMTRDVVDLAIAQDIVNVQWDENGGMVERHKVFAAMAIRVKSDAEQKCGVVHYTGA